MSETNAIVEAYSVVISVLLISCLVFGRDYKTKLGRLFLAMLIVNVLILANDIVAWVFDKNPKYNDLMMAANFFVYAWSYVFAALYTTYLTACIEQKETLRHAKAFLNTVYGTCTIAMLMLIASLFNHMYFYLDEHGAYIRGPLYSVSLIFSICLVFVNMAVTLAHHRALGLPDTLALMSYGAFPLIAMAVRIFIYDITFLYSSTTLSLLIIYIYIQNKQRQRLYRQERELAESRIALMISQIQPHFIFNTLNSIRELIYSDMDKADQMVVNFSKYLRANISSLQGTSVAFADELQNVGIYLSIEKERFGDKINYVEEIGCRSFCLPPLILQPIVENAVKHGICKKAEGGTVRLTTQPDGDYIKITVEDDGVGFDVAEKKADSVGIDNVKMRVKYLLGTDLKIESEPGNGTRVEILVPQNYAGRGSTVESNLCRRRKPGPESLLQNCGKYNRHNV